MKLNEVLEVMYYRYLPGCRWVREAVDASPSMPSMARAHALLYDGLKPLEEMTGGELRFGRCDLCDWEDFAAEELGQL